MWARVHKVDRVKPLPGGGAIIFVEDERNGIGMGRIASLSTLVATARILNAKRVLDLKFGGKGEVRYCARVALPSFLLDAVNRAGASHADASGDKVIVPAQPGATAGVVDAAFSELAHHVRTSVGSAVDFATALTKQEGFRRKSPIDKDANPAGYWTAVFELTSLVGELARSAGGRWVEIAEMPVPFAVKVEPKSNVEKSQLAMPWRLAMKIVDGTDTGESLNAPPPGTP